MRNPLNFLVLKPMSLCLNVDQTNNTNPIRSQGGGDLMLTICSPEKSISDPVVGKCWPLTLFFLLLFFCNPPHLVRMMRHPKHTSHRLLFNGLPTSCSESTARCWGATFQTFQLLVWLSAFQNMRTYAAGRAHRRKFKAVPEGEKVAKKNMASLTKRFLRGFWPPPKTAPLPLVLFTTCWLLVGSFV